MQIDDALERFFVQLEADGRSQHTIRQYRRHVRLLARWCADVGHTGAIETITHEDIARFLASPQARIRPDGAAKKAASVNVLRGTMKGFFRYLHEAGHIGQDPTRLTRRALCGTPPPRGLSQADQSRLLGTLTADDGLEAERDHVLFHLMLATGIRLSSALALDAEDVDLDRGEVQLRSTKGDRPERVFLGNAIREHLAKYMTGRDSGALFTTRRGRRISCRHAQRRFSEWIEKAGIKGPASPHSLRHSFALGLYQRTGDVLIVKEALRHRSITSTLVYARGDEERLKRALA